MRRFILTCSLIVLVVVLAAAATQDPRGRADAPSTVSLEFNGGTIAEYVEVIRRVVPESNIIVRPGASELPIGPLSLKRVDVNGAVELLAGEYEISHGRCHVHVNRIGGGREGIPVYMVDASFKRTMAGMDGLRVEVYAIEDLLKGDVDEGDLLTVIESAINMLAMGEEASRHELRFHEETGVLIARASSGQQELIHQILAQLRQSAERRENQRANAFEQHRFEMLFQDAAARAEMLEERLQAAEHMAAAKETEARLLIEENARLNDRVERLLEEITVVQQRLNQLEMMLAQAHAERDAARANKDGDG